VRELDFKIESACALAAGSHTVSLQLKIGSIFEDLHVHSIALGVQVQIEPARRRYSDEEKRALLEVFGEPERWPLTVRPLFWTTINANVPSFTGRTTFELLLPFPKENDIAPAKYLRALQSGEIPLSLLFSGRVFYSNDGVVQMAPIPWSKESQFQIPLHVYEQAATAESRESVGAGGATWM
jgi:hypothetical protein